MIGKGLLAAVVLAFSGTSALSETVFIGAITFTAVTPECTNVRVNDNAVSVFHPNIVGNESFAGLSVVWEFYSQGHALISSPTARVNFDESDRTVRTGGTGWGDAYIREPSKWAQIRVVSYSPALANIRSTTPFLTITGQIKRPFNDPAGLACVATFHASYVKDRRQ